MKVKDLNRMTKEERMIAECAFRRCVKIAHELQFLHDECEKLMTDFGWDALEPWNIAKAGMTVGKFGMDIAGAIGYEEWDCYEAEREAK